MNKSPFIRVLIFCVLLSSLIFIFINFFFSVDIFKTIKLTQYFAITSVVFLYLALLCKPLTSNFRNFFLSNIYIRYHKYFGIAAFYFGILHASIAFFGQLGGFSGLFFLSGKYLIAIGLSFTALTSLFAVTFYYIIKKKFPIFVDVFLYFAAFLILVHALMLGSHFQNLSSVTSQVALALVFFLIFLEILRFDDFLIKKFPNVKKLSSISAFLLFLILTILINFLFQPGDNGVSFGIHSEHIKIARESLESQNKPLAKNPALQGDKTKRYTVDIEYSQIPIPNQDTTIKFRVFDASNGKRVKLFNKVQGKLVHLIIVDSSLNYFTHIHPEFKNEEFIVTTQFPVDGRYHLYLDFQPFGAIEQQIASSVDVGEVITPLLPELKVDTDLSKVFGDYEVSLKKPNILKSDQISIGAQQLSFTINDSKSKRPIVNLRPYLDAFGHLVMINTKTHEYVHVHPSDLRIPDESESGGPTVNFMPIGLYGPIKPGIYRIFAQFNPSEELMVADFTIEIE